MELLAIILGLAAATCFGSSDSTIPLAATRLGTFKTTLYAKAIGMIVLILFTLIALRYLGLTNDNIRGSLLPGLAIGVISAAGYLAFYRGLKLGPLALVSPITAANGALAVVLATLILHDRLVTSQVVAIVVVFTGIALASTNLQEVHALLRDPRQVLASEGVRWALVAMVAFSGEIFGIGAAASRFGWFLPIFWDWFFTLCVLLMVALVQFKLSYSSDSKKHLTRTDTPVPHTRRWFDVSRILGNKGILLAGIAGILNVAGLLIYSIDTQVAVTSIAAALTSCNALIPFFVGIIGFHEHPALSQMFGVFLVVGGLVLLAIKP